MRFLIICASLIVAASATAEAGPFRRYQRTSNVYTTPQTSYAPAVQTASAVQMQPAATAMTTGVNGCDDALAEVNAERARRGLRPFLPDPALNQAARSCAQIRAARRISGHLPNDFSYVPAGASARSAGCGAMEPSWGWGTCCTYENYTYAGAAWAMGADGKRYMHLFVR